MTTKTSSPNYVPVIAGGVVAVIIIAIIVYAVLRRRGKPAEE